VGAGEDPDDALYPLKDVLAAVQHEDVARHTENMMENISQVGLSDISNLASKGQEVMS